MQENSLLRILDKTNTKFFFGALLLFQVLFIFQGFDFADEGSHSTFYQNIYTDPESVQYTFMYWFSGIVGGTWMRIFPGLLGLRVGGVLLTTVTAVVTYNLLKKYINPRYLKLGLVFILLMNCASVKDLNYNNISALLAVLSVLFLFGGLKDDRLFSLFLTGLFLSFATFTRISNASGLAMAALIVYSGFFIVRKSIIRQIIQLVFFFGGFIVTTAVIIGLMKAIGHYDIFMNCLGLLSNMSQSEEGHYGLFNLIKLILSEYLLGTFKVILPVTAIIILLTWIYNNARWKESNKKLFRAGAGIFAVILFLVFVKMKGISESSYLMLLLFACAALIATVFILFGKSKDELKILALSGTIMTLMLVAGSDVGFVGSGAGSLWIGLPIAIDFFFAVSAFSAVGSLTYADKTNQLTEIKPAVIITEKQLNSIRSLGSYLLLIFTLVYIFTYAYNDNANRAKMRYPVNSSFTKGVFTTRERSTVVNELLEESSKYIKKGDYVLAYETMPMFHALTGTKPYIRNAWPKLYDRAVLASELNLAFSEKKVLPVILYQKVKTAGNRNWPDLSDDNSRFDLNDLHNTSVREFLDNNRYRLAWENSAFRIYLPPAIK